MLFWSNEVMNCKTLCSPRHAAADRLGHNWWRRSNRSAWLWGVCDLFRPHLVNSGPTWRSTSVLKMIVSIMCAFLSACAAITSGLPVCYVLLQALVACILIRWAFNGDCLLLLAGPLFSALHLISPMSCDNQRRGQPGPCPPPWVVSVAATAGGRKKKRLPVRKLKFHFNWKAEMRRRTRFSATLIAVWHIRLW